MDQDSFRSLLGNSSSKSSKATTLGSASRSRGIAVPQTKQKKVDSSQPAFKPRKVKNAGDGKYRDRAAERRIGADNDFAHVEAVLHDFEQRNADIEDRDKIEAQRKYLGGDSEHSVLVKGLDFALLEQNKAKFGFTADDADEIEKALLESTSSHIEPVVPRKRTREDLVRELKAKRGKCESPATVPTEEAKDLEKAKQQGKFKPIGFKPIGAPDEKKKKKRVDGDKERKKKKRKVGEGTENGGNVDITDETQKASTSNAPNAPQVKGPPEPVNEDFDIFADVGEYEGLDIEDDDDEEDTAGASEAPPDGAAPAPPARRWIDDDEPPAPPPEPIAESSRVSRNSRNGSEGQLSEGEMSEDDIPMRLVPLASSALPSIKDLLEADKAAASYAKNKKKKDKKKKTKGDDDDDEDNDDQEDEKAKQKSMSAKVDRDYKKLKSYTDKKASGAS